MKAISSHCQAANSSWLLRPHGTLMYGIQAYNPTCICAQCAVNHVHPRSWRFRGFHLVHIQSRTQNRSSGHFDEIPSLYCYQLLDLRHLLPIKRCSTTFLIIENLEMISFGIHFFDRFYRSFPFCVPNRLPGLRSSVNSCLYLHDCLLSVVYLFP